MSTAQQQQTVGAGARFRTAFRAVTDVAMTVIALYGVWHQEHTGTQKPWLLLTYVVILGLIPATHAVALARAALSQPSQPQDLSASTSGTGSPPQPPVA